MNIKFLLEKKENNKSMKYKYLSFENYVCSDGEVVKIVGVHTVDPGSSPTLSNFLSSKVFFFPSFISFFPLEFSIFYYNFLPE